MVFIQPGASSSSCPILRPYLALRATKNKYLNFKRRQKDFDFVCLFVVLFTKRPNAGSSRLKEGSIAPMSSEGAPRPQVANLGPHFVLADAIGTSGPHLGHLSLRSLALAGT